MEIEQIYKSFDELRDQTVGKQFNNFTATEIHGYIHYAGKFERLIKLMQERERDNIQNSITPPMMFVEVPAPDSRLHKQMGYLIEAKEELDNIPNWVRRVFKKKGQEDDGNNM